MAKSASVRPGSTPVRGGSAPGKGGTAKPDKDAKKATRTAKRAAAKDRRRQIWQAFQMQRKEDRKLLPILIGALLVTALLVTGLGVLLGSPWWIALLFGLVLGVMVGLIVFARRVQSNVYKQADGTPGAAAWSLQNNLRGKWRITPAVAGTSHLDAVHRVVGRPGIILVGEGVPHRVKPLIAQEKRRIARVVGETPIYDIVVGNEDGQTPLKRLNPSLMKLPRNISASAVSDLDNRLAALASKSGIQAGIPKGPMPAGAKMRNVQRSARRR